MKRTRKGLLLLAGLALVLGSCQFLPRSVLTPTAQASPPASPSSNPQPVESAAPTAAATPAPAAEMTLAAKEIHEKSDTPAYTIDARWPYLQWGADPRAEIFNQAAEAIASAEIASFREGLAKLPKDETTRGLTSSLKIDFMETIETQDLLAALIQVSFYTAGAAHPGHVFHALNFDLHAGRVLALADLFQPKSDYLQALSITCAEDLKSRGALIFEEGVQPKEENFTVWNITPDGLLITFNEYQVAPYALGPQSAMISYDRLKPVARPDGPLASFLNP